MMAMVSTLAARLPGACASSLASPPSCYGLGGKTVPDEEVRAWLEGRERR
jgi:hypothetical protein